MNASATSSPPLHSASAQESAGAEIPSLQDTDLRWNAPLAALQDFWRAHGHVRIPGRTRAERELLAWMQAQRERARAGDLTRAEHEGLAALGFDWEPRDREWERWVDQLRAFRRVHGHCTVPEREGELTQWVERVREQYHLGRLSANRVRTLDELGLSWELDREAGDARWALRWAELAEFRRAHGHCRVPSHSEEWPSLAVWVGSLRQQRRRGRISRARIEALDALGFDWEPGNAAQDARWEARFAQLVEYHRVHGHCCVPAKWVQDVAFGHWVHVQRAFRKNGKLSPERVRRLETLGFAWEGSDGRSDPHDVYLEKMLAALEAFRAEHGHTEVPTSYPDRTLAKWVLRQRTALRSGEMNAERRARLEAAGFVWRATRRQDAERWEARFAQLLAYRERFGHCRVPARWVEDRPWSHWVHNLRMFKKAGTLSAERIARLEAIGFEWKGEHFAAESLEGHWEKMFEHLTTFHARHGHTEASPRLSDPPALHGWVLNQREAMRNGTMPAERRARLEALGFTPRSTSRTNQERWEGRYQQLLAFRARFGHCRVPKNFPEDTGFGHWVGNQRIFQRQGKLSVERIARLEAIGFEWGRGVKVFSPGAPLIPAGF